MKKAIIMLLMLQFSIIGLYAERIYYEEVIIIASHTKTEKESVSPSAIVVTREDIENSNVQDLTKLLNLLTGIHLVRSGNAGQQSNMFIRGSRPSHIAVLFNGVKINDPSTVDNSFDFNNISIGEIERIEIIKSSHSSITGNNSMGGAVNIISRDNPEKPLDLWSNIGFTSAKGNYQNIFAGFTGEIFKASINLGNETQKDVHAADPDLLSNSSPDPYNKTFGTINLRLRHNSLTNETFIRHNYTRSHLDLMDASDDPNYVTRNRYINYINNMKAELKDMTLNLYLSRSDIRRHYNDEPDEYNMEFVDAIYKGLRDNQKLTMVFFDKFTLGMERMNTSMSYDYYSDGQFGPYHEIMEKTEQSTLSVFTDYNYQGVHHGILTGIRYDRHDKKGIITYRVSPYYSFGQGTTLYANISRGFKTPSLYELYSPYGNLELKDESSISYEISVRHRFSDNDLDMDLTYFYNKYDNLIDFDTFAWVYYNLGEVKTEGIELQLDYRMNHNLNIKFMSSYLNAVNNITGERLLRRPNFKHTLILNSKLPYNFNLWTELCFVSKRDDVVFDDNFNLVTVPLDEYYSLNISLSKTITDNLSAYFRVDNILDENYHYIKGYAKSNRLIFLGIKYSI